MKMRTSILPVVAAAVLLVATAGVASGARSKDSRNPWSVGDVRRAPSDVVREEKAPVVAGVYAIVALAGICVVGFKKATRTHLD